MKELSWPVEETGLVAAERDREGVGVQRVGTGMDRAMEPAREKDFVTAAVTAPKKAAERDREGVGVQRVGTGMDREMEPAREKDFVTAAATAPKKAVEREPGTVTAQAGGKVAATEQIRKI